MTTPSVPHSPALVPPRGHIPALDGLRGLAILLVIPHNTDVFAADVTYLWPAAVLAHAGWIGVQLFFVLSGFLITGNLLDSQRAPNYYSAFFARRALRIFPLYFGVLCVGLLVLPRLGMLSPESLATHENQVWLWTFLVNWSEPLGHAVAGFPHFWSLAIEEQFYLVWPLLVHKRSPQAVWRLCVAIVVLAFAIRIGMLAADAKSEMLYMFTVSRMDALAIGAACAALLRMPAAAAAMQRQQRYYGAAGLALGCVAMIATRGFELYGTTTFTFGYPLLATAFALLLLAALAAPRGANAAYQSILTAGPLRSVGKYSYAMYVLHMPIQLTLGPRVLPGLEAATPLYPLLYPLLIGVLSYGAAFTTYHLYEKQFLKMKRYFVPASA